MGYGIVIPGPPRFVAGETYTFNEMTCMLAERLGVGLPNVTQFTARMRKFIRLGLCASRQRGSGNASKYTAYDALQFYVAMRLNLVGLNPESITPLVDWTCRDLPPDARSPVSIWLEPAYGTARSELLLEIPDDILRAGLAALEGDR